MQRDPTVYNPSSELKPDRLTGEGRHHFGERQAAFDRLLRVLLPPGMSSPDVHCRFRKALKSHARDERRLEVTQCDRPKRKVVLSVREVLDQLTLEEIAKLTESEASLSAGCTRALFTANSPYECMRLWSQETSSIKDL
jgi:hypothetical protein